MPEFPWISHYAKGVPAKIDPDFCPSIPGLLERVAKDYADYPAFISMEQPLTYRQVNDISSDLAGYLQSLSTLKPGDRVAIMMPISGVPFRRSEGGLHRGQREPPLHRPRTA